VIAEISGLLMPGAKQEIAENRSLACKIASLVAGERYQPTLQGFFVLKLNRLRAAKRKLGPEVYHSRGLLFGGKCVSPAPDHLSCTPLDLSGPSRLLTLVVEPYFRSNPSTGSGIAPVQNEAPKRRFR